MDIVGDREVWLTSFWGYSPESWGCIGFTEEVDRDAFLRKAPDGCLIAIYVTGNRARPDGIPMKGKVVGLMELSRKTGIVQDFISAEEVEFLRTEIENGKWRYSVQARRAWSFVPEEWLPVAEFAPTTYRPELGRHISRRCIRLTANEASRALGMNVVPRPLFRSGAPMAPELPMSALDAITFSQAGPVSQNPHVVAESEGPKRLYILRLVGNVDAMLGSVDAGGRDILKVGFSASPLSRRDTFQAALPGTGYRWEIVRANDRPWRNSQVAIAGEDAMKDAMRTAALGREFFLGSDADIERAWNAGQAAASRATK